jgi:hypothetical protein
MATALRQRESSQLPHALYWTSAALVAFAAMAAGLTLFVPGILRGTAVMNGSARGTAMVALLIAIPLLVASMAFASRSERAWITWIGAAGFLEYNAVLFLLATPFNSLFLLYVAMFGLGFWTIVLLLRTTDVEGFAARHGARIPARPLAP